MRAIEATLSRERFIFRDVTTAAQLEVGASNRIEVSGFSREGERCCTVVRGQYMHSTMRMAAALCERLEAGQNVLSNAAASEIQAEWDVTADFERTMLRESWVRVYVDGDPIFSDGPDQPMLDLVEKIHSECGAEYDAISKGLEEVLRGWSTPRAVEHLVNIAAVCRLTVDFARVSLILRIPRHSSTFSFTMKEKQFLYTEGKQLLKSHRCFEHAANWLELIQLAYSPRLDALQKADARKRKGYVDRLKRLQSGIVLAEEQFEVAYRPDRPSHENAIAAVSNKLIGAFS